MTNRQGLKRKAHFLGTKIKSLRKRNNLTLEDLSVRCIQIDAEAGPSVSYLSMIENGKRVPSERLLQIVAEIFQKDVNWFYDESLDSPAIDPAPLESAVSGIPLEPGFLFSENLLQLAIPELLAQTGTTGRQFAHLLIRAHRAKTISPGCRRRFRYCERTRSRSQVVRQVAVQRSRGHRRTAQYDRAVFLRCTQHHLPEQLSARHTVQAQIRSRQSHRPQGPA
jgi:transcriptional regulator with XRE-family HTH domain